MKQASWKLPCFLSCLLSYHCLAFLTLLMLLQFNFSPPFSPLIPYLFFTSSSLPRPPPPQEEDLKWVEENLPTSTIDK